ncbi:sarcolemmal membrane-associated protein [Anabrus simplex]|uniref:sarcolemmal membrane-associated protein n=1 Tax=Anabrus simplex TaxID=316456 RepID=UPI0034DDC4E0
MVVVSGSWMKNVVSYPGSADVIGTPKMAARAALMCRPNSHPFQERTLTLDQPVKIGRSVARARAAANNAIFDCKVLSRNHALLWYENGKFYLQDTKSSNGTFVNNQRLSKGSEESPPREVCSGDIVQFGVDVMENARKVTHGCIVATLKLYLPDGKEAKASPSTSVVSSVGMVPLEDLYQLNQYLQEALQREQLLENKLASLQQLVESTRQASDLGWRALIDEDRLLSRVEILENQLQTYSKNFAEDKLREELRKLQEDKSQYQGTAKESLQKVLQEKLEAIQKLNDLERALRNAEDECAHLKELRECSQQDLQELARKYSQQLQKVEELSSKLQETEEQHKEACERLEQEKQELAARLEEQRGIERALQARLDAVSKDGELSGRQLAALQSRIAVLHSKCLDPEEIKIDLDSSYKSTDSTGTQVDIILERIEPVEEVQDNMKEEMESLRCQLKKSEEQLKESHEKVDELHLRLEESRNQEYSNIEMTQHLEERLQDLEMELAKLQADNKNTEMAPQPISNQANKLRAEILKLEELLNETRAKKRLAEAHVVQIQKELDSAKLKVKKNTEELNFLKQQLQAVQSLVGEKSATSAQQEVQMQWLASVSNEMKQQVIQLQERVQVETERADQQAEAAELLRQQLMDAQQAAKQSHNEAEQMKDRLRSLQKESNEELIRLRQHCDSLQADASRLKLEYMLLQERHNVLQAAHLELQELNSRLVQQPDGMGLMTELEQYRQMHAQDCIKVESLEEELVIVKERYYHCNEEKTQLSKDLSNLREEYGNLATQTYAVLCFGLVPLIAVFLGMVVAFYPVLSYLTGTAEHTLDH